MGTEDSNINKNTITDFNLNLSLNTSDYNQIKSSISEESLSKTKSEKEKIIEKNNSNKIPVTFEWKEGGNSVYLSGNFCNWKQLFLMQKNSEGNFFLKLDINKGLIQYKFKVDNEWKINPNFPSIIDNGNLNNYIDITKLNIIKDKSEVTTDESSNKNSENKLYEIKNEKRNKKNYGNIFPKYKDMSENAIAPENFWKKINNKNKENKENIENEKINHLFVEIKDSKTDDNKNSNIISITTRYRFKFTKFIYYKNN